MNRNQRNGSGDIFFVFIALLILLVCAIVQYFIDKKRREKIRDYCAKNNFRYNDEPTAMSGYCEVFDIMSKGHTQYCRAGMFGKRGDLEINLIDYYYVTGHGKRRRTSSHTLCQIHASNAFFPKFFVREENAIMDSLGSMLGGQDIDFREDKSFSDKFVLQGSDEGSVRILFCNRVRKAFIDNHLSGFRYEGMGKCFLLYIHGCTTIEKRLQMLEKALRIFNAMISSGAVRDPELDFENKYKSQYVQDRISPKSTKTPVSNQNQASNNGYNRDYYNKKPYGSYVTGYSKDKYKSGKEGIGNPSFADNDPFKGF